MNNSPTGLIFNIQKFCIHDGPGIRSTVFFKGCPLHCRWCANPESQCSSQQIMYDEHCCLHCGCCVNTCPGGHIQLVEQAVVIDRASCAGCGRCVNACMIYGGKALSMMGERKSVDEVVAELLKDAVFYTASGGGVTFSGGEVLAQLDFAAALAAQLRLHNIHIACETTGYAPAEDFSRLLDFTSLLLFDVKHYDDTMHQKGTGVSNVQILRNLRTAVSAGKNVIARIPIIPSFNDRPGDIDGFGQLLQDIGISEVHLLPFHQFGQGKYEKLGMPYDYHGISSIQKEDLVPMKAALESYAAHVQIGG